MKRARGEIAFAAGSLTYTRGGIAVLAFWLLWGDFAFAFFENIFGRFLPLFLRDLEASNTLVGLMTGGLVGIVNVLCLPGISRWSDRFRSPRGRRIPFLLVATPITVLALVCAGFSPEISGLLYPLFPGWLGKFLSAQVFTLSLLCVFVVAYDFFNMVLVNGYNWLLRDVVPDKIMARFLSWFRIINTLSGMIFLWFVFPYVMSHRAEVFLGVGAFYLVAFTLMCFKVKEGDYPPPKEEAGRPGFFKGMLAYFRECLGHPIYRYYVLVSVMWYLVSGCTNPFITLLMNETLKLDMGDMGMLFAINAGVSVLVLYPVGWACDRFGPLKITVLTLAVQIAISAAALFFVGSKGTMTAYLILAALPVVSWKLASFAASVKIFPKSQFGQFVSALNVFGTGAMVAGNVLIGALIDACGDNYRIAFAWAGIFAIAALVCMLRVLKLYRKLGGPDNYTAPVPG